MEERKDDPQIQLSTLHLAPPTRPQPVTDLGKEPHKLSHAAPLIKAKAAEVVDLAEDGRGGGRGRVDGEEGDGVDLHGGDSVCGVDVLCVCGECMCVYGGEVVQQGYDGVANSFTPFVYNTTTVLVIDVINGSGH